MTTFTGKSRRGLLVGFLAGVLILVASQERADEEKAPPTRVARISYVDGSVSLQPGGQGDWGSAAKNRPVTIGDKIWVDKDSRVELQAGTAAIHLGSMTALSFLNLDQGITQMRLAEGSINFRVSELREDDLYEVDAPNLAFTVKQAGAFLIDVNEKGDSVRLTPDGLPTAMAIGTGLGRGAGPGLTILRGALLHSTTAVGRSSAALGVGARARFLARPFMGLRL